MKIVTFILIHTYRRVEKQSHILINNIIQCEISVLVIDKDWKKQW